MVPSAPPTEAVRIFVHFTEQVPNPTCTSLPSSNVRLLMACIGRQAAATKAKIDLDGRFFGGRTVASSFYDEKVHHPRHFPAGRKSENRQDAQAEHVLSLQEFAEGRLVPPEVAAREERSRSRFS